jgi:hypothetical protein
MSNNQWPQPELSLGAPYGSMDILGRYKFWEIKKNSPAHLSWRTISEQIINLLEDQLAPLNADLMVEMVMIAQQDAKPNPTILFRSQNKATRQKAIALVNERSVLASHPGVLTAECSLLPKPLVIEDVLGLPDLPPGVYCSDALRHCGASVIISGEQARTLRNATLGGIVCIDGLFYGITTAHACSGAPEVAVDLQAEIDFALYGLGGFDIAPEQEYNGVEITSKGGLRVF